MELVVWIIFGVVCILTCRRNNVPEGDVQHVQQAHLGRVWDAH